MQKKRIDLTSQQRSQAQRSSQKTYLHVEGRFCYFKDVRAQMQLFMLHKSFLLILMFILRDSSVWPICSCKLHPNFQLTVRAQTPSFAILFVWPINRSKLISHLSKKSHTYHLFTKHI